MLAIVALGGLLTALVTADMAVAAEKLPRCFLDITADGKPLGRIVIELRSDVVPRTAENFRAVHRRERVRLQELDVPPRDSRLHVPGRRLYGA